jgi:hypothetical protein
LSLTVVLDEAADLVAKDRDIDDDAVQHVVRQAELPQTFDGLQRARDMVEWRLEASAWELSVVLRERFEQQGFLAQIDEAMRRFEESADDGDGDTGGDVGGDEGGSDSVPGDSDASNLSTVGGSVAGGGRDDVEDGDIVEMLGGV